MNRRMPNGTSVWCGRTAGAIPPPTRSIVIRERHRRGTHFFLNQSAAFGNRGCQRDDGILYQGPTKEVAEKGRTGSETRPLQRIWFFRSL
jgi:hypothetical protein